MCQGGSIRAWRVHAFATLVRLGRRGSLGYTAGQLTQHFRRHNLLETTLIATLTSQMRSRIRGAKYWTQSAQLAWTERKDYSYSDSESNAFLGMPQVEFPHECCI